ncbi:MAG: RNA methyltransferase [Acidobacteria bacterium]|nr:RNA methyltransferase [Acidobacteriota bacterium]
MISIQSRQHPFVQRCRQLARGYDPETGDVLLDGLHLVGEALSAGLGGLTVAVRPDVREQPDVARLVDQLAAAGAVVLDAAAEVVAAASPVRTPSGIVAIASFRLAPLGEIFRRAPALVVAAIDVQDPGNVGAIVRSAEAAGATGVVVAGQSADPLGWKAIRGSMGSVFRTPVARAETIEGLLEGAHARGLLVIATTPAGGLALFEMDLAQPALVLVGGEGGGLAPSIVASADARMRIPMDLPVESLNVAVATGVILFEARRQRLAASRL